MKYHSLSLLLLLFIACSKDNNDPKKPVTLLDKTYTFYDTNNTGPIQMYYVDSLEYNNKDQVSKIDVYRGTTDTLSYTFSYNNNGDITEMHKKNAKNSLENYDYTFYYNTDKRVDSISQIGAQESFYSILKYTTQHKLSEVFTYATSPGAPALISHNTYYRSTQLDSVVADNLYPNSLQRMHLTYNASTVAPAPILALNKAYLLLQAERTNFKTLFATSSIPNFFTNQVANPDELVMRDGSFTYYDITGYPYIPYQQPFTNTFTLNTAGAVDNYHFVFLNGQSNSHTYIQFEYITR